MSKYLYTPNIEEDQEVMPEDPNNLTTKLREECTTSNNVIVDKQSRVCRQRNNEEKG